MGFGALFLLSILGAAHAVRAAWVLNVLQEEAVKVVDKWQSDPKGSEQGWIVLWKWPIRRDVQPPPGWVTSLLNPKYAWLFSPLNFWVYVIGLLFFLSLFGCSLYRYVS